MLLGTTLLLGSGQEYEWLLALVVFFVMLLVFAAMKGYAWAGMLIIFVGYIRRNPKDAGSIGASGSSVPGKGPKLNFRISGPASIVVIWCGTIITVVGIISGIPSAWPLATEAAGKAASPIISLLQPHKTAATDEKLRTEDERAVRDESEIELKNQASRDWATVSIEERHAELQEMDDLYDSMREGRGEEPKASEKPNWDKVIREIAVVRLSISKSLGVATQPTTLSTPSTLPSNKEGFFP